MRDVAIVAFAQSAHRRRTDELSEVDLLMPVLHEVLGATGLKANEIGFTCSGSADYLAGRAFSFTMALDGVGAHPPISESHVEMDGAWALYEAWVKIQTGEADTALVYSYGKSSPGRIRDVLTRQLDPYYLAPLWPDSVALAALQAQALIDAGDTDEGTLAEIAARNRTAAVDNPYAQLTGDVPAGDHLVHPLRTGDCPPIGDGAAAVVLAAGDTAR
ncbi:lipid-transfer protein, partial [Streptomyces parvus]|nr:lipid-transfer protein [Streptomyces parvus]